jgi:1,4-dihydroxy-6-naphthoate synthase
MITSMTTSMTTSMKTMSIKTKISIAFSPDTDDAFMVHAMRQGLVDTGAYEFTYTAADIQELNDAARRQTYDVTAISVAAYPSLAADYLLMPVGASVGDAFGPALIVAEGSTLLHPAELAGRRVAVPGLQTSAFFAARAVIGAFTPVPLPFREIAPAVRSGAVDGGLLIHELQLDPSREGCRKLGDLGKLWFARHQLPLPLGANAIRRDLGLPVIKDITRVMRASIVRGLERRQETLAAALAQSQAAVDLDGGDRYISMYVNRRSLALQDDVRAATQALFAAGAAAGLCPEVGLEQALYE